MEKDQKVIAGKNGGTLMPWQKGQSGNPKGRPKKVISRLQDKIEQDFKVTLTRADVGQIVRSMMELNLAQLETIAKDKKTPAFMVLIANKIFHDIKHGSISSFVTLMSLTGFEDNPDAPVSSPTYRTAEDLINELNQRDQLRVSFKGDAPEYIDFEQM